MPGVVAEFLLLDSMTALSLSIVGAYSSASTHR